MKPLNYNDIVHRPNWGENHNAKYAIDWERNEEKFKAPFQEVRVYQSGAVKLTQSGYNDPDFRNRLRSELGIRVELVNEARVKLFTPDGIPVPKNKLKSCGGVMLLDEKSGRALMGNYQGFYWASQDYPPATTGKFAAFSRNEPKEQELIAKTRDMFALGETMLSMVPPQYSLTPWEWQRKVRVFMHNPRGLDAQKELTTLHCLGWAARTPTYLNRLIQQMCQDTTEFEYLLFKENDK